MPKKDTILKELLADPVRFADLFNGTIFEGEKILDSEELFSEPTEIAVTINEGKDNSISIQRFRDVIKKYSHDTEFIIFACENQTSVHYAMPVRNMLYDALTYTQQVKAIVKAHRINKDLKRSSEFLSDFKKEDSIIPVVTLIVYYGEEKWDGSVDLHGMINFTKNSELIKKYVPNYEMNLLCICDVEELNKYESDLRELFGMIKFSSDKKQMKEYVKSNQERFSNMDSLTYEVISEFLDNKNYLEIIKTKVETERGGYNMCLAFEQMIEEGREQGIEQGIKLAAQRIAFSLIDVLDIQTISEKTGLTVEEIENLRK